MASQALVPENERDRSLPPISAEQLDRLTKRLAETAEDYDRSAEFPRANFDLLAREGLIGLTVPRELGGHGASLSEAIRVLGAVAKGEPSTALILFMTFHYHATPARARNWPQHIYEELAREAVAGCGLIGGLRVEPELGTPVRGGLPATVARRTTDGWAISGTKIYSTGSTGLDWFSVWARTDEDSPRVGNFLVRANSPGTDIEPAWDHLGMRATVSHAVHFTDTPTPFDHAVDIRRPEQWATGAGDPNLAIWNALSISTIYDGVARAARDWLRAYLNDRVPTNLGASLATLPRVQERFGEIEALLQVNRTMIRDAAARHDAGDPSSAVEVNNIKYLATANAIRAVEIGLELTGNPGISRRNPLERHYRDVLCSRIHSPQTDTILIAAGRAALGN
ncbi:acyl-CoA dehydrogenase family protein [Sphingobium sp.]|uniref:acyl-CoA dehydrogenase family protein n=1 Tax=Sphingobium sp. TaxID=1912891 RepID=UPI002BDFB739|nr:acyl-CoA dehydrogenase family protein [Sphingobium sp.]HUD91813.1 acyl-CoA dehydrogenase family protein [Sphingobium sp.]